MTTAVLAPTKTSDTVREWPEAWTCYGNHRVVTDDAIQLCTVGLMCELLGEDANSINRYPAMKRGYGLDSLQVDALSMAHEIQGKDAAADMLASWGM